MKRSILRLLALSAVLATVGCTTSIEVYVNYQNKNSAACRQCQTTSCSVEATAVVSNLSCTAETGAALACGSNSCYVATATTASCRQLTDALISCTVRNCDSSCR